jgi:hypothetical protein
MSEDLVGKNEPAYPVSDASCCQYGGLTKRELFAAMAMQGMRADHSATGVPEAIARESVRLADALLKELAK